MGTQILSGAITGAGNLTKAGASTLILTGTNTYSGATNITAGTLQVGNGGTVGTIGLGNITNNSALVFDLSSNVIVSSSITSGSGTLTQMGSGTLQLNGTNTYTGTTTVNSGGTMKAGSATAFGGYAPMIVNGTLDLNGFSNTVGALSGSGTVTSSSTAATLYAGYGAANTVNTTFSGAVADGAGVMSLHQAGSSTLNLTGINTFSGALTIDSAGLIVVSGVGSLGSGSYPGAILNSGVLTFNTSAVQTLSGALSGSGILNQSGSGPLTLSGANTFTGTTNISNSSTLNWNGTAISPNYGPTNIANGSTLNITASTGTLFASGTNPFSGEVYTSCLFSGAGTINVQPSSYVYLINTSASHTFSGTLNVNGPLFSGYPSGGNGTGISMQSATLNVGSTGTFGLGYSEIYFGAVSGSGAIINGYPSTQETLFVGYNNASTTFSGTIHGNSSSAAFANVEAGSTELYKVGTGTLTLTTPHTYSAGTAISNGTILLLSTGNLGVAQCNVNSAGTLQVGNGTTAGTAPTVIINLNSGNYLFNQPVSSPTTVATVIEGAGTVTQSGAGALTLSGANTYTGVTNVNAGTTLNVTASALNTSTTGEVIISATANVNLLGTTGTFSAPQISDYWYGGTGTINIPNTAWVSLNNAINPQPFSGTLNVSGNASFWTTTYFNNATINNTGQVSITSNAVDLGAITGNGAFFQGWNTLNYPLNVGFNNTSTTFSGTIHGNNSSSTQGNIECGLLQFNKYGTGTLTLTTPHTYSGGTNITAGSVILTNTGNVGTVANCNVNTGAFLQIGNGTTAGAPPAVTVNMNNGTYLFNQPSGSNSTVSTVISGAGNVSQQGTGTTVTLSGANTFTGGMVLGSGTVTNANVVVTGAALNTTVTGLTNVYTGNTLTLTATTGTYVGPQFFASPLAGAGTVNIGSTNWIGLDTATNPQTFTGTLNVSGNAVCWTTTYLQNATMNVTGQFATATNDLYIGAITGNGAIFQGWNASGYTLRVGWNNASSTFSGVIHGNNTSSTQGNLEYGALTLLKTGTGALTLTGANTYTSGTTLQQGSIVLTGAGTLGPGACIISSGATLSIGNGTTAGLDPTVSVPITNGGTLMFNQPSGTNDTYAGVLTGAGTVSVNNAGGVVNITNMQSYSGGFTVTNGICVANLTNGTAAHTFGALNVSSGAVLTVDFGTQANAPGNVITANPVINGTLNLLTGAPTTDTDGSTFSGGSAGLNFTGSGTINIVSGEFELWSGAGSVMNMTGFTGTVSIASGSTFGVDNNAVVSATAAQFAVNGTLNLHTSGITLDGLTGTGSVTSNGSGTLALGIGAGNSTSTFGGVISNGSAILTVTKTGTGNITLSGTNTYSGTTTVSAGTLTAGNLHAFGTGSIFVAAGATLAKNGFAISNTITGPGTVTP